MSKEKNIAAFFALLRAGLWEDVVVNGEELKVNNLTRIYDPEMVFR